MSDVNVPPIQGTNTLPSNVTITAPEGTPDKITSIREAARLLQAQRKPKEAASAAPPAAEPQPELASPEADTGPETVPSETEETPAVEESLPPIEPPRSWSKEDKDTFASLPRETQERVAERERSRETDFLRRQNEAAEAQKALEAQRQAAEQTRQQYENALPVLLQTLQSQQAGAFSDIKTMEDVTRLANDDWPRYIQWDAHQKQLAAIHQEILASQQRQEQERVSNWQQFAAKEDALFAESVPDIADPEKGPKLRASAISYLKDLGYTETELQQQWESGYLRDHKVQRMILDAVKRHDAERHVKTAPAKPVPPVQRPGVSRGANADAESTIKALDQKLDQSGSWKAAAELLMARRKASRR